MRFIFSYILIILIFGLSSCSKYEKLLKSSDYEAKYQAAVKYYEEENYNKAYPLLEELVSLFRGTERAEKIYYYYAYTNYYMDDLIMAGYHFKNFVKTYPSSPFAEECMYMNAYCHYLMSPQASLDQTSTLSAINEFQLFVNRYPESKKVAEANEMIDKLRFKLELKAYEIAKQYYHTENYQSAVVAINNLLKDFPGTKFAEELSFLKIKAQYLYAINSIEAKKQDRLKTTLESYYTFIDKFAQSDYVKEAESIYSNTSKILQKQTTNP